MPRKPDNGKKDRGWRIAFGLLPWVDALLLCSAAAFFLDKAALVPGQSVDLQKAEFTDGARAGRAVFLIVGETSDGYIVAFDGGDYGMTDAESRAKFIGKLRDGDNEDGLVVYADKSIPHGKIMEFLAVLREAGVKNVNFATDPD